MRHVTGRNAAYGRVTPSITRVDFVTIPSQDVERGTAFHRGTLGLAHSERTVDTPFSEFNLGATTLNVWDPSTAGRAFHANTNAVALHTDDVHAMREQLEGNGVMFVGETVDTRRVPHGVCSPTPTATR